MKFLCLCYYDIGKFAALTPAQLAEVGPNCRPFDVKLRGTGKAIVQSSLADPWEWKSIRPSGGKPVVSDGPLTSAPEQAGAFFVVDAETMDEAVAVASNHAAANYGEHIGFAVEVRRCESFD